MEGRREPKGCQIVERKEIHEEKKRKDESDGKSKKDM